MSRGVVDEGLEAAKAGGFLFRAYDPPGGDTPVGGGLGLEKGPGFAIAFELLGAGWTEFRVFALEGVAHGEGLVAGGEDLAAPATGACTPARLRDRFHDIEHWINFWWPKLT